MAVRSVSFKNTKRDKDLLEYIDSKEEFSAWVKEACEYYRNKELNEARRAVVNHLNNSEGLPIENIPSTINKASKTIEDDIFKKEIIDLGQKVYNKFEQDIPGDNPPTGSVLTYKKEEVNNTKTKLIDVEDF